MYTARQEIVIFIAAVDFCGASLSFFGFYSATASTSLFFSLATCTIDKNSGCLLLLLLLLRLTHAH